MVVEDEALPRHLCFEQRAADFAEVAGQNGVIILRRGAKRRKAGQQG